MEACASHRHHLAASCGASHSTQKEETTMTRLTRKLRSTTGLVVLLTVGLLTFAATAAYASGSSCNGGSCEDVNGSGLHVTTTDTYAQTPHCNQNLDTMQFDQKGYIVTEE